jgi:uncharacterized membrane protein YqjE
MALDPKEPRGIAQILSDLLRNLSRLLEQEFDLLKREAEEKSSQLVRAGLAVLAGFLLALAALLCLIAALIAVLVDAGLSLPWAALLVAAGVGGIGAVCIYWGLSRLRRENLLPRRTIREFRRDKSAIKENFS